MAILIKNAEVERKARELASRRGLTITAVIDGALDRELAASEPRRRPTIEEMEAATDRLWKESGASGPFAPVTKAERDAISALRGFHEDEG